MSTQKQELVEQLAKSVVKLNLFNYKELCKDEQIDENGTDFVNYGTSRNQVENTLMVFLTDVVKEVSQKQHELSELIY